MEALKKFAIAISKTSVEPQMFGHVHLICLGIMLTLIVLLCIFAKNWQEKNVKRVMLAVWIIMLLAEAYKQFIWPFNYGGSENKFIWGAFPFQLCSTPLYVLPFYIFSKKENVKHACAAFLMTFSLFGGLVTMIYPPQVFIDIIGVNVQTMVHHGLQVVIGVFLACYYRKNLNFKFFLKGIIVYLILFAIALSLNFIVPQFIDESFNMFYISMYEACTLPLLGDIVYPNVPWIAFLIIYFIGFAGIALLIMYVEKGIYLLTTLKARKNADSANQVQTQNIEIKDNKAESEITEKEIQKVEENNNEEIELEAKNIEVSEHILKTTKVASAKKPASAKSKSTSSKTKSASSTSKSASGKNAGEKSISSELKSSSSAKTSKASSSKTSAKTSKASSSKTPKASSNKTSAKTSKASSSKTSAKSTKIKR